MILAQPRNFYAEAPRAAPDVAPVRSEFCAPPGVPHIAHDAGSVEMPNMIRLVGSLAHPQVEVVAGRVAWPRGLRGREKNVAAPQLAGEMPRAYVQAMCVRDMRSAIAAEPYRYYRATDGSPR